MQTPTIDASTEARWEQLTARLADEMARGFSLTRIAIEAGLSAQRSHLSNTQPADRLRAWTVDPEAMRFNRNAGELAPAEEIEQKLEKWFSELDAERATQTAPAAAQFI